MKKRSKAWQEIYAIEARGRTVAEAARAAWEGMDDNAKHGIRFGLFPAELMRELETQGFKSQEISLALIDCANRDGGMRA